MLSSTIETRPSRSHGRKFRLMCAAALAGLVPLGYCFGGSVATDGSVGARTTLTGPTFNIPASLGQQKGGNLFHSFSTFSLAKNDVASFSGPANVNNVVARVTGGNVSNIDGTVQCTIAGANFYLINPSGVIFGPDAAIDVKGAFVVTTADYLKFADGSHFNATNLADTVLTSAAPAAFGFLAAKPSAITVSGATLSNPSGAISIVGGDVRITGVIQSPGQRVNLISAGAAGELNFDPASLTATIDLSNGPALGDVSLTNASVITSGIGGGKISVRASSVEVLASVLVAQNTGSANGGGIDIVSTGPVNLSPAIVGTDTSAAGNAGPISITATDLTIDGSTLPNVSTGISSGTSATGHGGAMTFNVNSLKLAGGSAIYTGTGGAGDAGSVTINALGDVRVDGAGTTSSGIVAATVGAGRGGDITLSAASVELANGGSLGSSTFVSGNAGNISVTANSISIDNTVGTLANRGIIAAAFSPGTGNAGQITLQTGALSVTGGSTVNTSTFSTGAGGQITVKGGTILLDGGTSTLATGLTAESFGTSAGAGPSGNITVAGTTTQILGGAVIGVDTAGPGAVGAIHLSADALTIDGRGLSSTPFAGTGIVARGFSATDAPAAGTISVDANAVTLVNGGIISGSNFGAGSAAAVTVNAVRTLTIDSQGSGLLTGIFSDGTDGPAGTVAVTSPNILLLPGGSISAESNGLGNAGIIAVSATTSLIADQQDTDAPTGIFAGGTDGAGGQMQVTGGSISILGGAEFRTGAFGAGDGGTLTVNAHSLSIEDPAGGNSLINVSSTLGTGPAGTANVTADTLSIGPGGHIQASAGDPALAGTINVTATAFTMTGGTYTSSVAAVSEGGGNSGTINVQAGTLQLTDGAVISASTQGLGHGGMVNVSADAITIDGRGSASNTGIYAESVLPPGGQTIGDAGSVNVKASSIQLLNGGVISTSTAGNAAGGDTTVAVTGNLTIDGKTATLITGIYADSLAGGSGGKVQVSAGAISLSNGGKITTDAQDAGSAGTVSVQGGSLQIASGAAISSDTNSTGNGGNVSVVVTGAITLDGLGSDLNVTGISANSNNFVAGGNAGGTTVKAKSIVMRNGSHIGSDTENAGSGGDVNVVANKIQIDGNASITAITFAGGRGGNVLVTSRDLLIDAVGAANFTGITAQTTADGNAGTVDISAHRARLINGGEISSTTFATGAGGTVNIFADTLSMKKKSIIASASIDTGTAGLIDIRVSETLSMFRSQITSQALKVGGGGVSVHAGQDVNMKGSKISAQAGGEGGSVSIVSPNVINLVNSKVLTQAGDNGGNMIVDPSFVVLDHSTLSANGGNNGGDISVRPTYLLSSNSAITATGARGVSGSLQITPDYNLTGALISLPTVLSDNLTLQPQCAADLPGVISSFIVTGRGGSPLEPGGWSTDLDLRLPTIRTADKPVR